MSLASLVDQFIQSGPSAKKIPDYLSIKNGLLPL